MAYFAIFNLKKHHKANLLEPLKNNTAINICFS